MDDFAVFLRGAGFVFLLFVLFFVFLFPEETFLASFEEEDVPDGEDEDCARIREEIGKRLIFFFPFFLTLFFALVFLARALEDEEEYDEQHIIVVISKLLCNREYYFSLCLSVSFIIKYYYTCLCVLFRERHKRNVFLSHYSRMCLSSFEFYTYAREV